MKTQLSEEALVELRRKGFAARTTFIDPVVMARANQVMRRRGELWVASVLGRDTTRRSRINPAVIWLNDGEQYTLVAADKAEDKLAMDEIGGL